MTYTSVKLTGKYHIPEEISLHWPRMFIFTNISRDINESLNSYYNALINKDGYVLSRSSNGTLRMKPVSVCYGDRTSQRRRTYEIISLIQDIILHRTIEYGDSLFYF